MMQKLDAASKWKYFLGEPDFLIESWSGPIPPANHPKYLHTVNQIRRQLQSYNILQEIVTHYVNALIGQAPHWYVKDINGKVQGTQAEVLLQSWLDWQKQLRQNRISEGLYNSPLAQAIAQALVTETGYLRLYSPQRYANNPDPTKRIVLHCPKQGSIKVDRDDDGFLYRVEYTYGAGKKETYTLLDNGVCEIISPTETYQLDLGGRLPVFPISLNGLITPDVISCQNSVNKTLTMKSINVDSGGFLERVILNGQMPGDWVKGDDGEDTFIPDTNFNLAANELAFITGMPIGDPKNPSGFTNPTVTYRQPVDVSTFRDSVNIDISLIYRRVGLGHLLTTADGAISGVSRETIKQDFQTRLEGYAEAIEDVVSSIYSVVLQLLGVSQYEPVVSLRFSAGKPLPEERQENRADYLAGLRSRTTAMSASGIDDPDAEEELIKREREQDQQPGTQEINQDIPELQTEESEIPAGDTQPD